VKVEVRARNETHRFECEPGEKILHAGLRAGIGLPYECATGTCGTCKARLVEGDIRSDWPDAPGHARLAREAGEFLMCQARAPADCAIEVARAVHASGDIAPANVGGVIRSTARLTHDVTAVDVELTRALRFEAGQFAIVRAPGIDGARAYSMVNFAPSTERLTFVVKRKPGGLMSEWICAGGATGTRVLLFGPLGHATFAPGVAKPLLCIAGGSGIAGMMAILACAVQARHFERHPGDLYFGVRTRRDVFFLDELAALRSSAGPALGITVALSEEDVDPDLAARFPALRFARGLVHEVAGAGMRGRFASVRAYAAGPPPMVDATLRMLLRDGRLPPADIRYDKFS
jgi:toluene monooxygenase electron transfer component